MIHMGIAQDEANAIVSEGIPCLHKQISINVKKNNQNNASKCIPTSPGINNYFT